MINYPAGVTDATIDALFEDEQQEREREAADRVLLASPLWRRYVSANRPTRRRNLVEAIHEAAYQGGATDLGLLDLSDYAENLRACVVASARARGRRKT